MSYGDLVAPKQRLLSSIVHPEAIRGNTLSCVETWSSLIHNRQHTMTIGHGISSKFLDSVESMREKKANGYTHGDVNNVLWI